MADASDAWVLETVDRQWAARQIKDVYSISNCLTIHSEFDMSSPGLIDLAIQKGLIKSKTHFDYAKDYSDFIFTVGSRGRGRRNTTICALEEQKGKVNIESMMNILRSHDSSENPQKGLFASVCSHAGFGPTRSSQSTASLVAYLDGTTPVIFATGTSAPCTGIFKPIWMDAGLPDLGAIPTAQYDPSSLYWTHERLHRATILNYPERIKTYESDRDALEKKFIEGALKLKGAPVKERSDFTAACFRQAAQAETEWLARVEKISARPTFFQSLGWNGFNQKAKMPVIK
jgi:dipeptidase